MSDDAIKELLRPFCRQGRLWSSRADDNFLYLRGSLRDIWRGSEELYSQLAYSTLARKLRLHQPRLGIGVARCRGDLCSSCRVWDTVMEPGLAAAMKDIRIGAQEIDQHFWDDFDKELEMHKWKLASLPFLTSRPSMTFC